MNRKKILAAALILIGLLLSACGDIVSMDGIIPDVPGDGGTNSLMLTWPAPTTNEDGSPLEDLAGYRVYYGNESGNYIFVADVGKYSTVEISALTTNTWYVAVTAYDFFGNESEYSDEFSYTFY